MFEGVEVEGLFLVDCGEVRVWITLGSGDCERADGPGWWGGGVPVGELGDVEHFVSFLQEGFERCLLCGWWRGSSGQFYRAMNLLHSPC